MYLAATDKELERKQKEVYALNQRIISNYQNLPFYKRIFATPPDEEIMSNWRDFRIWMDARIKREMARERLKP